jgi:hypothetical protein
VNFSPSRHANRYGDDPDRATREVIDRITANTRNPELRASLEHSPLIQQVYDLSASD